MNSDLKYYYQGNIPDMDINYNTNPQSPILSIKNVTVINPHFIYFSCNCQSANVTDIQIQIQI